MLTFFRWKLLFSPITKQPSFSRFRWLSSFVSTFQALPEAKLFLRPQISYLNFSFLFSFRFYYSIKPIFPIKPSSHNFLIFLFLRRIFLSTLRWKLSLRAFVGRLGLVGFWALIFHFDFALEAHRKVEDVLLINLVGVAVKASPARRCSFQQMPEDVRRGIQVLVIEKFTFDERRFTVLEERWWWELWWGQLWQHRWSS